MKFSPLELVQFLAGKSLMQADWRNFFRTCHLRNLIYTLAIMWQRQFRCNALWFCGLVRNGTWWSDIYYRVKSLSCSWRTFAHMVSLLFDNLFPEFCHHSLTAHWDERVQSMNHWFNQVRFPEMETQPFCFRSWI